MTQFHFSQKTVRNTVEWTHAHIHGPFAQLGEWPRHSALWVFLFNQSLMRPLLLVRSPASPSWGLFQNRLRIPGAHCIQRKPIPRPQGSGLLAPRPPRVTALWFTPQAQSSRPEMGLMSEWVGPVGLSAHATHDVCPSHHAWPLALSLGHLSALSTVPGT